MADPELAEKLMAPGLEVQPGANDFDFVGRCYLL